MSTQRPTTATPRPSERLLQIFDMAVEDAIAPFDGGHAALPDFALTQIEEALDEIQFEHHQYRPPANSVVCAPVLLGAH